MKVLTVHQPWATLIACGALAVTHALEGRWPLAAQFTVYTGLAVWGWFAWGRDGA